MANQPSTTATVVTIEPAVASRGACKGRNLTGVVSVLYSDGTVMARCTQCDYESPDTHRVTAHRRKHTTLPKRPRGTGKDSRQRQVAKAIRVLTTYTAETPFEDMAALKRKIASLQDRLSAERKARKEAEANLAAIRRALQG